MMHKYHLQLNEIVGAENIENASRNLEFEFENHDDIFRVVSFMQESGRFPDNQQAEQFAVGLKLFSAVMMQNRESELFRDFQPAFVEFMKKLKGK